MVAAVAVAAAARIAAHLAFDHQFVTFMSKYVFELHAQSIFALYSTYLVKISYSNNNLRQLMVWIYQ